MATTQKNLTIDMLDQIENPDERFRILAMYVKQLGSQISGVKNGCSPARDALKTSIAQLQYLLKGANGDGGGIVGQIDMLSKKLDLLGKKQEMLEDRFNTLNTSVRITMAKAAVIMSAVMVVLIPILGKVIDKLLP